MDRVVAEDGAPVMLSPSTATRIFVALEPVDMRQNFNGLYARVQSVLQQDPLSGHFFVFTNRSRTLSTRKTS
jgi:transposase